MTNNFSFQDSILDGITIDDIITATLSNEKEITEATVTKVFNEILKIQLTDAKFMLNKHMQDIIKEVKANRE